MLKNEAGRIRTNFDKTLKNSQKLAATNKGRIKKKATSKW